jgi:hypothetical protein
LIKFSNHPIFKFFTILGSLLTLHALPSAHYGGMAYAEQATVVFPIKELFVPDCKFVFNHGLRRFSLLREI